MGTKQNISGATAATARASLASALLSRMARPGLDKVALYPGSAPVWSANVVSQIPGGTLRTPRRAAIGGLPVALDDDPNFRYHGINAMSYGAAFPFTILPLPMPTPGGVVTGLPRLSFNYDGQTFEFGALFTSTTPNFRLWVDGKLATADLGNPLGVVAMSTLYYCKCDLGSQASRLIEIEFDSSVDFYGIQVEPTASMSRGPRPSLRVAVLGDSIAGGAGAYSSATSWAGQFCQLMGSDVYLWNLALGGTGYSVSAGTTDFITRLPDIIAARPDILFIEGQQNDQAQSNAQLQALANTLFAALRLALPRTLIFVIGAYSPGRPTAARIGHEAALRAAALANTCLFVSWVDPSAAAVAGSGVPTWAAAIAYLTGATVLDPSGVPQTCITAHTSTGTFDQTKFKATAVFFGTGHVGATTGDGNADVMIQSDAVHPTLRGSIALGRVTYYGVQSALRDFVMTGSTTAIAPGPGVR